ncbi:MAG TPA: type II secretion system protein [Acidimicrobiales bacterium]|nr:type II secretion system protein [Acidimicrobiales bacterium]
MTRGVMKLFLPAMSDATSGLGPDEGGYTLVETLLTVLVVSIVLAAAFPVLPVFFRESNIVQNTYQSVDQLVLASEVATRYVHEAVSPSSSTNPFSSANANNVTFYANTGKSTGPEKVVMQVATAGSVRTFQVNLYVANANTCPMTGSSGTACVYGTSTQSFLLINFLTNGTAGSPVFTYNLQGGEVCGGPPPSSPTTTLSQSASSGATTLKVNQPHGAISVGDTIFIGSGPNAQIVTATAAAASTSTSVTVTALTAAAANTAAIYDSSLTNVPNSPPTTVSATSSGTTLKVNALQSAIATGDSIVVGTGSSAQTVTAGNNYAKGTTGNITVSALSGSVTSGTSVYDSTCSATQTSQIGGVALNLQATRNPGGQPTGYQSQAYLFSPEYNAAVG